MVLQAKRYSHCLENTTRHNNTKITDFVIDIRNNNFNELFNELQQMNN